MLASHTVPVDAPAEQVDLPDWFFTMSDSLYRAASGAHYAFGRYATDDGRRGATCVEYVGGALLVHHYEEVEASPQRLRLRSDATTLWMLRLIPQRITTGVDMRLEPDGGDRSLLTVSVEVSTTNLLLKPFLATPVMRAVTTAHLRDEMPAFARDIAARCGAPR